MGMLEDRLAIVQGLNASTPSFIIDEAILEHNLKILKETKDASGASVLAALKAFSFPRVFPLMAQYVDGVCASGLNEAQLGREIENWEVHTYAPAYSETEFPEIARQSEVVIFNSPTQLERFQKIARTNDCEIGIRVNPGHAEATGELYNACVPGSRFGMSREDLNKLDLTNVDGLHFHALDQQYVDALERVLASFEERFGDAVKNFKWVNFGGGHLITSPEYNRERLVKIITDFKEKHRVQVYLEPGFAIAKNAGYLVTTVLDIMHNGMNIAILDTSAECHMPDVISAVPYRPEIVGAGEPNKKRHTYRLGGPTCLAGDRIGDYSFDEPLKVGDKLIFTDMAAYTFVKTTMFNGMKHPTLALLTKSGKLEIVRKFDYRDYRNRLDSA